MRFFSASSAAEAITRTASTGNQPVAVSPESISASVPSSTAFATSATSARVGSRERNIDSSIWVAVMTGLPSSLLLAMIFFCQNGTPYLSMFTPKSPRATMMPSLTGTAEQWKDAVEILEGLPGLDLRDDEKVNSEAA